MAPLVNLGIRIGSVGRLAQRTLGIAPQRSLPGFARMPLTRWMNERANSNEVIEKPSRRVVLFNDTFNTYQDADVGVAAVILLERLGYEVILPGHACCGRTYISKGLVDESRRLAEDVIQKLFPLALEGLPIVGLEPSCILSLRDEYDALIPNDPRVELVAEHAVTFEEFIVAELVDGAIERNLWSSETDKKALVHGHCHQKSLVGMEPSRRALELAGFDVEIVDSGCCGMAGAFGYEAEHYDWSIKMAERVLAPAVRAASEDCVVVASGTSCRAQISDTTGRAALHPVQVLLDALR